MCQLCKRSLPALYAAHLSAADSSQSVDHSMAPGCLDASGAGGQASSGVGQLLRPVAGAAGLDVGTHTSTGVVEPLVD